MATDFQCQRLTLRPHKTFATAGLLSALLAVQMLGGCETPQSTRVATNQPTLAPVLNENVPNKIPGQRELAPLFNAKVPNRIPDEYIVVFKASTRKDDALAVQEQAVRLGGTIEYVYRLGRTGFSAKLPPAAREALRADPHVAFIECNQNGTPNTVQDFTSPNINWPMSQWPKGLDRTSERLLGNPPNQLDKRYTYSEDGTGVHVYVVDTGIRAGHSEFGERVLGGVNVADSRPSTDDARTGDCGGHGTFMAGIIGGAGVGIAKGATLHPVRVTNCPSSNPYRANIFASGIEWVIDQVSNHGLSPAVINFSHSFVSDSNTSMLDLKVNDAIDAGIVVVISAGPNSTTDACFNSPASVNAPYQSDHLNKPAIVVGAVDPETDTRTSASSYGGCLNLFAPGANILSAGYTASNSYILLLSADAGTSSAAAHVTGVVARYLQTHPTATPTQVWAALHRANNIYPSTTGWSGINNPGTGSPNELLHYGQSDDGWSDEPPTSPSSVPTPPVNLNIQ